MEQAVLLLALLVVLMLVRAGGVVVMLAPQAQELAEVAVLAVMLVTEAEAEIVGLILEALDQVELVAVGEVRLLVLAVAVAV